MSQKGQLSDVGFTSDITILTGYIYIIFLISSNSLLKYKENGNDEEKINDDCVMKLRMKSTLIYKY